MAKFFSKQHAEVMTISGSKQKSLFWTTWSVKWKWHLPVVGKGLSYVRM